MAETLSLISLMLFSLADLRYRSAPAIELFFFAAVLLAVPMVNPLHLAIVVLIVGWGYIQKFPRWLAVIMLFYPPLWPLALVAFGVRKGMIGRLDLLAMGAIASLFAWPALILSLLGMEFWRRWWVRKGKLGPVPALPGMAVGVAIFMGVRLIVSSITGMPIIFS